MYIGRSDPSVGYSTLFYSSLVTLLITLHMAPNYVHIIVLGVLCDSTFGRMPHNILLYIMRNSSFVSDMIVS